MAEALKLDTGGIATAGALAFVIKTVTNSARKVAVEVEDGDTPFAVGTTEPDPFAAERTQSSHEINHLATLRPNAEHDASAARFN